MKKLFFVLLTILTFSKGIAQELLPPLERFSTKKEGYLIKNDGTRIDFVLSDLDRKKGLIVNVEGKTTDGKKFKLKADQIKELAIPPSDLSKFAALNNSTRSIVKMQQTKTSQYNRELVYFFQEYVEDRKVTALMQLLNPDFSNKIVVYNDPWAAETMGIGVMGVPITGGIDKSFYLKVDGKTKRYFKSDYNGDFKKLFSSCPNLIKEYKNFAWRDLPKHIFYFENECEEK